MEEKELNITPEENFHLQLSRQESGMILSALSELPWKHVNSLILKMQNQIRGQVKRETNVSKTKSEKKDDSRSIEPVEKKVSLNSNKKSSPTST